MALDDAYSCPDLAVEAMTYSRVGSLKRFHVRVTKSGSHLGLESQGRIKSSAQTRQVMSLLKPQETPSIPALFTSFALYCPEINPLPFRVSGGPGEGRMGRLPCFRWVRGNLGVIDAPVFHCRLGNAMVFILPPF